MEITIEVPLRPYSINQDRTDHFRTRTKRIRRDREIAKECARDAIFDNGLKTLPVFSHVAIDVFPWSIDRRFDQDPANCLPTVKAIIDGFCDARIIFDDARRFVDWIRFYPHSFGEDKTVVRLTGPLFDAEREVLPMKTIPML